MTMPAPEVIEREKDKLYVTDAELFPDEMTGARGVPAEKWESYDEPYKVSYAEYVKVQREKDAGAYSVKAALERCGRLSDGWLPSLCTPAEAAAGRTVRRWSRNRCRFLGFRSRTSAHSGSSATASMP